jgi:hypothetical protein
MLFKSETFDIFYPEDEGVIEARKRLHSTAISAYEALWSIREWIDHVKASPDLLHYMELTGGEDSLEHLAELVWNSRRFR